MLSPRKGRTPISTPSTVGTPTGADMWVRPYRKEIRYIFCDLSALWGATWGLVER
jgi:hypothetical protein